MEYLTKPLQISLEGDNLLKLKPSIGEKKLTTGINAASTHIPLVSIVIPARDSERTIGICLESIKRQNYPMIEVIVVDQESRDSTLDICRNYGVKVITIPKTTLYTPPTKSRNRGAKIAKGKYLLHLDSDMELAPGLIKECVYRLERSDAGAVVIHEIDVATGFWGQCKALERKCYVGDPYLEGARFVKREIFDDVGGYDETLSFGEDWDIHQRYKDITKIQSIQSVIKHHSGYISFLEQVKKKHAYGKTANSYIRKYPKESRKQLFLRTAYFRNWRLLANDPIHATGFIFIKLCEYYATGLGLLTG